MSKVIVCDICGRNGGNPSVGIIKFKRKRTFETFFEGKDNKFVNFDICYDCYKEIEIKMKLKGEQP